MAHPIAMSEMALLGLELKCPMPTSCLRWPGRMLRGLAYCRVIKTVVDCSIGCIARLHGVDISFMFCRPSLL
eukprot:1161832-Pelagomonas_calceolata.AAC.3